MRRRTKLGASTVLVVTVIAGSALLGPSAATAQAAGGFEDNLPFWVWRALPQVFPEYIPGPGGYLSFGFDWTRGEQLPEGLTMTEGSIPRIHSEDAASPGPKGVGGAPANIEGYKAFLIAAAKDPRFTAENILPIIYYNVHLSLLQKLRYKYMVIPQTREALLSLEQG